MSLIHHRMELAPVEEEVEEQTENRATEMARSKSDSVWFVHDPCGIACAVATYIFLVYGEMVVLLVVLPPFPTVSMLLVVLLFTALVFLSIASHLKAMLTDPVCNGDVP